MSNISQIIKENPIKAVVTILSFCCSFVVAVWAVEDRYVLKKELETTKIILQHERQTAYNHLKDLIIMQHEDQITDLRVKKFNSTATPEELMRLETLEKRLDNLSSE